MTYLFVIHIPIVFSKGKYRMPKLAAVDLLAHRRLLPASVRLVVAAPVTESLNTPLLPLDGIEVAPLKYENSLGRCMGIFLPNWQALWKEIRRADLVHTGCGGWPFFLSPCFQAHLIALAQNKARLFVMDCDLVGKLEEDQIARTTNPWKKIVWIAYAKMAWQLFKFCLKTTGASFLLGRGVVNRYGPYANNPLEIYQPIAGPEDLIPDKKLREKLKSISCGERLKAVFIGRLAHEKGVEVLLQAIAILKKKSHIALAVDILGDGPERARLEQISGTLKIEAHFHGALEWGEPLFRQLRKSHFFVITHLTEEMTRTAFEGPASGCALICSDTAALRQLINDSGSGKVFKRGSAGDLARVLMDLLTERKTLVNLIKNGVNFFKENHRDAHIVRRINFLARVFPDLKLEIRDWNKQ